MYNYDFYIEVLIYLSKDFLVIYSKIIHIIIKRSYLQV